MALFFIHGFDRSDPEFFPRKQVRFSQPYSGQEGDRRHQQVVEHLREVRANHSLERRIFF